MARIAILTEGRTNPSDAKTACGMLRYRREEVVGLIDSTRAGKTAGELMGAGGDIPVVSRLDEVDADTFLIGIAPVGGGLPAEWRPILRQAIERGMTIISGLHVFFADDPELRTLSEKSGARMVDLRRPPSDLTVSRNIARDTPCFRVHTVGNDCNVGKMLTSVEVARALEERGHRAEFVPTGQTGILIAGWGVPIDRVISDFVPGAIEELIVEHQDSEFLIIEGQGSLVHPLYSGVTLGLLHGCAPQAMILCYEMGARTVRHAADMPLPPLEEVVEHYERMASIVCPSRVIAFSVNTSKFSTEEAAREIETMEDHFGRPATDPVRFGTDKLATAILEAAGK